MKAKSGHYRAGSSGFSNVSVSYHYGNYDRSGMPPRLLHPQSDYSVIPLDRVRAAASCISQRKTRTEPAVDSSRPKLGLLTRRRRDVLALLVQGRSNKEIARALDLAEGTVKIHVAALFTKLSIHRRAAVALTAAQIFGDSEVLGHTA